jgi:hypothetical protein
MFCGLAAQTLYAKPFAAGPQVSFARLETGDEAARAALDEPNAMGDDSYDWLRYS